MSQNTIVPPGRLFFWNRKDKAQGRQGVEDSLPTQVEVHHHLRLGESGRHSILDGYWDGRSPAYRSHPRRDD